MTTPNTATAAVRKRSSAYDDDDDDDEPSPKKALPDFSIRKGEEDSVISGDDSEGWLDMEEKLADNLSAQAKVDDALDEAAFPDIPMNEVHEWELMEGEGNADDDIPIANAPPPLQYETIQIGYQKATIKVLTDVAQRLGIAKTGVKRKLFDRIRDSTHVVKVDDDSFDFTV